MCDCHRIASILPRPKRLGANGHTLGSRHEASHTDVHKEVTHGAMHMHTSLGVGAV